MIAEIACKTVAECNYENLRTSWQYGTIMLIVILIAVVAIVAIYHEYHHGRKL